MDSRFPLGSVTPNELKQLAVVLWSWTICAECLDEKVCQTEGCPWPRTTILSRYFQFYKNLTATYESDVRSGEQPGLASHESLFSIIREIKANPGITRLQLLEKTFPTRPARSDQERAINIAVRTMMMVNCSGSRPSSALLEYGSRDAVWHNDIAFSQFMTSAFPKTDHPSIEDIKGGLKAKKLQKNAGLKFLPTDDLRNHLKLDRNCATVQIFHHTAVLKEHLRRSKNSARNLSVSDYIELGTLPQELALETLDSIRIIFPLNDPKSKAILLSLTSTSTSNFDPDILRFDAATIRDPDEIVSYQYFGTRLADIHEELANPSPRGMWKWVERKSSPRFVMMATITGFVVAIVLGLSSLAVGGYQSWIGYQQWQHPISSG